MVAPVAKPAANVATLNPEAYEAKALAGDA